MSMHRRSQLLRWVRLSDKITYCVNAALCMEMIFLLFFKRCVNKGITEKCVMIWGQRVFLVSQPLYFHCFFCGHFLQCMFLLMRIMSLPVMWSVSGESPAGPFGGKGSRSFSGRPVCPRSVSLPTSSSWGRGDLDKHHNTFTHTNLEAVSQVSSPAAWILWLLSLTFCCFFFLRLLNSALCWRKPSGGARICRASSATRCWRWSAPRPTWRSCCSTTPDCSRTPRSTRVWKEDTMPCSTGEGAEGQQTGLIGT